MKSKEILQDENRKLTVIEKIVPASGGMTGTFFFQMIQMYLLFFYTDVFKISPMYVAGLFLVALFLSLLPKGTMFFALKYNC